MTGDLEVGRPVIDPEAVVAPTAVVHGDVRIAARAFVLFGVVIRAELDRIEIGEESNVQDNSVLHCDEGIPALIGRRVTVGHAAVVHGAVVGDSCLVGIGARVLNGAEMGEGSWLAAGSVLTEGKSIPPWTLAMGIPAKAVRDLRPDEVARQSSGVDTYLRLARHYAGSAWPGGPTTP